MRKVMTKSEFLVVGNKFMIKGKKPIINCIP